MSTDVTPTRLPSGYAGRVAGFYAAVFVVYGVQLPFLPLWLDARGLTAAEIALASSLPLIVRLVATPAIAMAADQRHAHVRATVILSMLAVAVSLLLPLAPGVAAIIALLIVFLVAVQSTMPLIETIAMRGVLIGGLDYGRMRLWGSVTFMVANVAGGLVIGVFGPGTVPWILILGTVLTLSAAMLLPDGDRSSGAGRESVGWVDTTRRPLQMAPVGRLLGSTPIVILLLATGAIQASHAVLYVFSAVHWTSLGVTSTWVGLLWAIGVMAEIMLFANSAAVVRLFGAVTLLLAGGLAGAFRWTIMAFDPPLALLIPLQVLHALTFGATHLAAMHLIADLVDDKHAGTAQSLHATVTSGIAMAGAILVSGPLYEMLKAGAYLAMALLAGAGALAALALMRQR
jgi:PPP family 3-phenylpropionic acid transporter